MSTVEFNASIQVTELLMRTLENAAKDLATRCIKECACCERKEIKHPNAIHE